MTRREPAVDSARRGVPDFDSTRWSVVLAAGRGASADAQEALGILCRDYWYPLYAYVRRRGHAVHESQDLIQEFFARLLEKDAIAAADPERGRFRAFLLTSLRNFLSKERDKAGAKKRGGGSRPLSLDFRWGESRLAREPADESTPEKLFDRRWAETLLEHVATRLRDELVRSGRREHFEHLKPFLSGRNPSLSYEEAAGRLGISEGAAMVAAHRMRRRFREILRREITQTVASPEAVDEEIRSLFAALGRSGPGGGQEKGCKVSALFR